MMDKAKQFYDQGYEAGKAEMQAYLNDCERNYKEMFNTMTASVSGHKKSSQEFLKSNEVVKELEAALLVYANKEHLMGPLAESEPGYIKGKQVTICRHIGQTANEALKKLNNARAALRKDGE